MTQAGALAERQLPAGSSWRRDRLFYSGMGIAAALVVFAGFAPTYYLKGAFGGRPLSPLLHAHGLIFTSWIVLFVVQTGLIASRRTPLELPTYILNDARCAALGELQFGAGRRVAGSRRQAVPLRSRS